MNTPTQRTATNESPCDVCARLLAEMNDASLAVHRYIIEHRDQRAVNESYLGDLGRLIQAQVVTHHNLVQHQRDHATTEDPHVQQAV